VLGLGVDLGLGSQDLGLRDKVFGLVSCSLVCLVFMLTKLVL